LETAFRVAASLSSSVGFTAGVGDPGSGMSFGVDVERAAGERVKNPEMVDSRPRDWLAVGDVIESGILGDLTVVQPRMNVGIVVLEHDVDRVQVGVTFQHLINFI
jgi:hypothetical protein